MCKLDDLFVVAEPLEQVLEDLDGLVVPAELGQESAQHRLVDGVVGLVASRHSRRMLDGLVELAGVAQQVGQEQLDSASLGIELRAACRRRLGGVGVAGPAMEFGQGRQGAGRSSRRDTSSISCSRVAAASAYCSICRWRVGDLAVGSAATGIWASSSRWSLRSLSSRRGLLAAPRSGLAMKREDRERRSGQRRRLGLRAARSRRRASPRPAHHRRPRPGAAADGLLAVGPGRRPRRTPSAGRRPSSA